MPSRSDSQRDLLPVGVPGLPATALAEHYRRLADRLARLQSLTAALARARTANEVSDVLLHEAVPALDAEVGELAILSADGAFLREVGFSSVSPERARAPREYPIDSPLPVAEAARLGESIVITTGEERDRRYPALAGLLGLGKAGAVAAFPMFADGKLLGVLGFCFASAREFSNQDLAFLQTLADQCALAIERAQLHELAQHEIAVRKTAEAALTEAARRKDEFLAMLAHELRNPLAPIRNAAQTLRQLGDKFAVSESQTAHVLEIIDRQSAHMAHMVDDLLDVSRVTQGRMLLRKARLDLSVLVRATVNDHRPALEAAGFVVELAIPDRAVWIEADATRISQAVANLLHNSQKFTSAGGVITVSLGVDSSESRAEICVQDSGVGMEPTILASAFEPFVQADRSLSRSRGGLGLGLPLVKGLIELHGGSARAESAGLGQGSRFVLLLPLASEGTIASAAPALPAPAAISAAPTQRRILLIEDNVDAAEILGMWLEMDGHEVKIAHDGAQGVALALAEDWVPEIVLSDIGLPGDLDGYAVARTLRSAKQPVSTSYLIALSGYGQERDKQLARDAGFDRHLTKPVDPEVLQRVLASALVLRS